MTQEQATIATAEMTVPCPDTGIQLPSFCILRRDGSVLTLQRLGFSFTTSGDSTGLYTHARTHACMHAHTVLLQIAKVLCIENI